MYIPDITRSIDWYLKHKNWFQIHTARNETISSSQINAAREREMREIITTVLPYDGADHYIEVRLKDPDNTDSDLYLVPYQDSGILNDIKKL